MKIFSTIVLIVILIYFDDYISKNLDSHSGMQLRLLVSMIVFPIIYIFHRDSFASMGGPGETLELPSSNVFTDRRKLKGLLIIERFIGLGFALFVSYSFFKLFSSQFSEMKGGPTYILTAGFTWYNFRILYRFVSDLIQLKKIRQPWDLTLLEIDSHRMMSWARNAKWQQPLGAALFGLIILFYVPTSSFLWFISFIGVQLNSEFAIAAYKKEFRLLGE